jgi:hypothetical protein
LTPPSSSFGPKAWTPRSLRRNRRQVAKHHPSRRSQASTPLQGRIRRPCLRPLTHQPATSKRVSRPLPASQRPSTRRCPATWSSASLLEFLPPTTHEFPRSPVHASLPHSPPSDFRVPHPPAGLLLLEPCGPVSSRKRPWGFPLQGLSPPSEVTGSSPAASPPAVTRVARRRRPDRLQGLAPERRSVPACRGVGPAGGRCPPGFSKPSPGFDPPCNGVGFPSPPLVCFGPKPRTPGSCYAGGIPPVRRREMTLSRFLARARRSGR